MVALATVGLALSQGASAAVLYTQGWDGTSNLYASQTDTTVGGFGSFSASYDDFTLGAASSIDNVGFTGGFFNPATAVPITSFRIRFFSDSAGAPGASVFDQTIAAAGTGTSLGTVDGFPMFSYSVNLASAFAATASTRYWISIVANLPFPPEWGLATSSGGNGDAYQDFLGSRGRVGALAFTLNGSRTSVPEPGTLALLALGLIGLGLARRRTRTSI